MASYIGSIEQNDGKEDFQCYLDRLEQFMVANEITGDGTKKAVLDRLKIGFLKN